MFWTIALGIIVGGVGLFVILRNWETAKALTKLLLIGLSALALIAVVIGGVLLAGAAILAPILHPPSQATPAASPPIPDSSNDTFVQLVQNWRPYPSVPVFGEAAKRFFGSPSWEHFKADDRTDRVNLYGTLTVGGKITKADLQFIADIETDTVQLVYVGFEGAPQNKNRATELLAAMYKQRP